MNFKVLMLLAIFVSVAFTNCNGQKNKGQVKESNKKTAIMYLTASDTTGLLMDEDQFWKLIEKARVAANNNYQTQIVTLKSALLALEPKEIEKFDNTFTALLASTYDWKLWGAAYVINGGCSDDCFDYFRQYLIGQGKDRFYQTLKDPESCVDWIKSEGDDEWEGLQYSAMDAYKQKTGKDLPRSYMPKFELKGEEFDEETVHKKYPKLAKKFM